MSLSAGVPIESLIAEGTSLVFIVFPTIFNSMGVIGMILAPLLFLAIFFAGITSAIGYFEPLLGSLTDKLGIGRKKTASILSVIGLAISLLFVTGIGSYLVSLVDGFVNEFGILILIAVQCIIFAWVWGIDQLVDIVNRNSRVKVGTKWKIVLKYILPTALIIMWAWGLVGLFASVTTFELMVYVTLVVGIFLAAVGLTKYKGKTSESV